LPTRGNRVEVRPQGSHREALLPQAWSEFIDARCRMLTNSLQNVDEIGVDVDTMEPAGHNEALDDTNLFGAKFGPTEIPIFSTVGIARNERSK
jgi:hypothetical protein